MLTAGLGTAVTCLLGRSVEEAKVAQSFLKVL